MISTPVGYVWILSVIRTSKSLPFEALSRIKTIDDPKLEQTVKNQIKVSGYKSQTYLIYPSVQVRSQTCCTCHGYTEGVICQCTGGHLLVLFCTRNTHLFHLLDDISI